MKLAGYLVLISSSVTAFCLALLAYTLATGELPFEWHPLLAVAPGERALLPRREPQSELRRQETLATELLKDLEQQRARLATERASLADDQAAATELIKHAELLQARMKKAQEDVLKLLDLVDDRQKANLQGMAKLLGNTESKAAATIIAEMPAKEAARVMYYMNQRQSAEILTTIVSGDPTKAKFAAELTLGMRRIAEEADVSQLVPAAAAKP